MTLLVPTRLSSGLVAGLSVKLGARGEDGSAGFEQTAEVIGVDRLRHVDHAIRLQREDLVDIARRLDADRRQATQLAGVAPGLGLAINIKADQFQIRVLDQGPQRPRNDIRSEARRVGKEWVRTCRSRGSPYP